MSVALFILAVLLTAFFWHRIVPDRPPVMLQASQEDMVGEAGIESFPCSDPPAWTLGLHRGDRDGWRVD